MSLKSKQKYYSINNLCKHDCEYNILLGERSNGKSYAVKYKMLWEAYHEKDYGEHFINAKDKYKKRYQFAYVRRWREEIKNRDIELYFSDMPIAEITNNEYNTIISYRGDIYFGKEEDGASEKGKLIGKAFALTGVTHYKSLSFPYIGNVVFEEFITNQGYLPHEVDNLQSLISTIARREKVNVYMVGNTISRLCPYFDEWQLTHVKKQEQGTIDIYKQPTSQIDENGNNIVVSIAVEYCENSGSNSKMFFGQKSKMTTSGVWESDSYPHLQESFNTYKCAYKIYYEYNSFKFIICLMQNKNNEPFLYVYPAKERGKIKRVVSNKFNIDRYTTLYLQNLSKYDTIVNELISNQKIVYSDNLTGTEFNQIKKERGRF